MAMRFNPNPRPRVRGIYIPPCGESHSPETTYRNWCPRCVDIRKLELLQEQNSLLAEQMENRGWKPRRQYTPPPPPLPPAPEKKTPSGGADVRPRSSSTA